MLPIAQNQSILFVQQLHQNVTREIIFKEFKKFGTIKSLNHFVKKNSAFVEFSTPEEANAAKLSLNHKVILNKEINIVNQLFIHSFPQESETSSQQSNMSTLQVNQLDENVSKKFILKQFQKFGSIKSLKHFAKKGSALVEFQTPEEAKAAKSSLNHTKFLNKEINIVNYQIKDELKQKKKYNLFIQNVPQDLETSVLHDFMSKYGEITSLMLKKNEENKNLGYGYIQFETEESYNQIMKEHEQNGKISFPNSSISFNVQKIKNKQKKKSNSITILGLFQHEIPADQKQEKTNQINDFFGQVKKDLEILHFNYYTQYNEIKKNFWVKIDFQYDDDQEEEHIYKTVKEYVQKTYQYEGAQSKGPTIKFNSNEINERNLYLKGVRFNINEQDIADWILKTINVLVEPENIKIYNNVKPILDSKKQKEKDISVFFDSQVDGKRFMVFCADPSNKNLVDEIFHNRHKVTLYLKKNEQNNISKLNKIINFFK
ncbi:hypothetical protein ABPG74_021399 [Tetrahymena malaccensis]